MNSNTLSAFQRIIEEAKAKAEAQATGKKYTPPPTPKATAVPIPLSSTTIADLIGQPKVVTTPNKYNLNVISYSDKAVAVVGDTYDVRHILRRIGGVWQPYLKCGKGWVFPKHKEALIKAEFGL
jgi:hypothetical protein